MKLKKTIMWAIIEPDTKVDHEVDIVAIDFTKDSVIDKFTPSASGWQTSLDFGYRCIQVQITLPEDLK